MTEGSDLLTQTAEQGISVQLSDEFGNEVDTFTFSPELRLRDLVAHAVDFDLPEGDYAAYLVERDAQGEETLARLASKTRLGDIELPEDGVVRIRFAPALRGAS